ncbi:tartronate semialdehyde reductase 2 [Hyphomicrobiales bacterium]|nr:tartronate semialdehyde reductase 2 [Hyphomicrobiales bacterium]CAH1693388.1 tartronate semialdehyde reductase 2 [Hyphomicrobiales bacterium]
MERLGFIGLGIMGRPMAERLIEAGHTVALYSRSCVPEALLAAGGHACSTPREVAAASDVVFVMVPDTPDVEKVLFSPDGVAKGLVPGSIVIDMSSISPLATKDLAHRINDLGCDYIDAPVSGGEVGAKAGTLSIMCGGPTAAFERVKPLLDLLGRNITLVGGNGDGQTCKVANQIIVALCIEAVAEGLLYAKKAGADPAMVRSALLGGFASSKVLEVHGERMISGNFAPGFRIKLHQKDLRNALDNAEALALDLPHLTSVMALFNACAAQHGSDLDHSALFLELEGRVRPSIA